MPGEQQGLSAHDAAMVAAQEAATQRAQEAAAPDQQGAPQAPQRPDHIPEKFWDAEKGEVRTDELLKSYSELEAKAGKQPEQPPADAQQAAAEEAVKAAKLDMAALESEFAETGALSEASLAALAGAGISKEMVDAYVEGRQAVVDRAVNEAFGLVGGKDQYASMIQWASTNLSAAEREAFDTAVVGSSAQIKQAILGLKAQFDAANGRDPSLIGGANGNGSDEADTPFASSAEMIAAMQDRRYRTDSAYRSKVERRAGLMP